MPSAQKITKTRGSPATVIAHQVNPLVVQVDFLGEPSTKKACGDMGDMACSSLTVETHEDNSVDVRDRWDCQSDGYVHGRRGTATAWFRHL